MKAGSLDYNLSRYFKRYCDDHSKFEHVGDIEHYKVLKDQDIYFLTTSDVGVAFFEVKVYGESEDLPYKNSSLINVVYVDAPFRGKNILEKFIWFLKKHESSSKILMGDVHSAMMVSAIQKLSKRFDTSWVKKDQKIKYDPAKLDDFYNSSGTTGWQIMFENSGIFENWPRFFNDSSPDFRQLYDWLIE